MEKEKQYYNNRFKTDFIDRCFKYIQEHKLSEPQAKKAIKKYEYKWREYCSMANRRKDRKINLNPNAFKLAVDSVLNKKAV